MKRSVSWCCAGLVLGLWLRASAAPLGVEFPGPPPGPALVTQQDGIFTLENNVLAASWRAMGNSLRPVSLVNKLSGAKFDQDGCEVFRLATGPTNAKPSEGVAVMMRLNADKIVVQLSRDGIAWSELTSFSRAEFPGEPKLVRIGKMSGTAEAKNHSTTGTIGEGSITELTPRPASIPSGRFDFKAAPHEARTVEYPFPAGSKVIGCRIDKGTDEGLTWGPALALIWEEGKRFLAVGVRDDRNPTFNILTSAGERITNAKLERYPGFELTASAFRLVAAPKMVRLAGIPAAIRVAERIDGQAIEADAVSERGLRVHWRAELRDGSSYVRQMIDLASPDVTARLSGVEFSDLHLPDLATIGRSPGCPVAGSGFFAGVEMPGAQNAVGLAGARIGFACQLAVSPEQSCHFGSVMGVAPEGQLRRAFLYYLERERARPSQPFLHYNCWYDLGYGVSEKGLLEVVTRFNEELVIKRGVPVLSYLADDGWDDPRQGLWVENQRKFPDGFAGLKSKMEKAGAHLGVWISPLGGYGGDKERRAHARNLGLIPATAEFDLSHPAYKKWFQARCLQLMREGGVNAFKWDRAGEGVNPHFMALLEIAPQLRKENPELFINVTVGTWPSPFWLNHVDSTWRNGSSDVGWTGPGSAPQHAKYNREKWLTYRDGYCRHFFAEMSPLYPLNSVMHHGIVHGREFQGGSIGQSNPPDLKNEARSYFANGAMLQELYLSPSLMTPAAWDSIAEAAQWAHANTDVLLDAHWVGGDPLKLEAYGYAAWNRRQGTLMLRNPGDRPQNIALDAATVFELPAGAARQYVLRSPYRDQRLQKLVLKAGQAQVVSLEPFEVLVFDAIAEGTSQPPVNKL